MPSHPAPSFGPGSRVRVGRSPRVHVISGTVYPRPGFGKTVCGYYGNPEHGWMRVTADDATCKRCLKGEGEST